MRTLKKEIIKDLKLNQAKEHLVYYLQCLVIYNQLPLIKNALLTEDYLQNVLCVFNREQFDMVIEEVVSLNQCCNLRCSQILSKEQVARLSRAKLRNEKDDSTKENDMTLIFCDKIKLKDVSKCE